MKLISTSDFHTKIYENSRRVLIIQIVFSLYLRFATAVPLISAAAAMAFVASGDRLVTVGSPSSQVSQDREAKGKMAGDPDAVLEKRPHYTERRPGRRVRGVQIRRADVSGQRDPAVDGAERQEHF